VTRTLTELDQFKEYVDEYENERLAVMDRLNQLQRCYIYIVEHLHNRLSKKHLCDVTRGALRLKKRLLLTHDSFKKRPHSRHSGGLVGVDPDVKAYTSHLKCRFRNAIGKGTHTVLRAIDNLIENCRSLLQKESNDGTKR